MITNTAWYGISVNGLAVSFGCFTLETPWDVMNVDTGEIRSFATYREACAFAREVGLP